MLAARAIPIYRVKKVVNFSAAHVLQHLPPDHPCMRPHGHNYKAEFTVVSELVDRTGMVLDFNMLKALTSMLDHQVINEVFQQTKFLGKADGETAAATAEEIARFLFEKVNAVILQLGEDPDEVRCVRVGVHETETCYAEYSVEL